MKDVIFQDKKPEIKKKFLTPRPIDPHAERYETSYYPNYTQPFQKATRIFLIVGGSFLLTFLIKALGQSLGFWDMQ